uniref:BED-type domain-containing protein n=1 Tax=Meloidogyne enterolobii TaxID=390850 RepID=A0A6V7Y5Z0_MELEN|nr:unnamed protein product [Meloidogyne enterolobii]
MSTKSSDIWNFFVKLPMADESARCKLCENKFSCKKSSTKGLWDHLKSMHLAEYEKFLQKNTSTSTNLDISKFLGKDEPQKKADEKIAALMLRQNCSFLFVEAPELRDLFQRAYPNLTLRRRNYFKRTVIPSMAEEIRLKITQRIGNDKYALTSDGWSQVTKSPALLSITVHHLNSSFERDDFVFDVVPMDSHTGEDICASIEKSLKDNGLNKENVVCLVRDAARNMIRSCNLLELNSFQCVCHMLHLTMNDLLETKELKVFIAKIRSWVTFFRTTKGSKILTKTQENLMLKNKKLIASCPTRWNSCFAMLKEFRDQKKVIMAIEGERRGFAANQAKRAKTDYIPESLPSLDMSDFELLRAICPIMEIFNKETEKFSKETSSASTVISTLKRLRDFLQEQNFSNRVAPFVQILIRSLNDRLPELSHNTILRSDSESEDNDNED